MNIIYKNLLSLYFKIKKIIFVFFTKKDQEFENIYNSCQKYTMTSKERMKALYDSVISVLGLKIDGDFVECGVWMGGSAMLIASTLKKTELQIKRYIFMILLRA